jgi:hypothetical protein
VIPDLIPGAANKSKRIREGLGERQMSQLKAKTCQVCGREYRPTISCQKYCKECAPQEYRAKKIKDHAAYYIAHREEALAYSVSYWRWNGPGRRHGITRNECDALLASQYGKCAICGTTLVPNNVTRNGTCIDHDHVTGKVRGLLCNNCNVALGHARDDPALLLKMVTYLTCKAESTV